MIKVTAYINEDIVNGKLRNIDVKCEVGNGTLCLWQHDNGRIIPSDKYLGELEFIEERKSESTLAAKEHFYKQL